MVIPEDEKTEQQKLEEEIAALQTKIKNTEYDLTHMFKGNDIVEQKLHNTKKLMEEKQDRLAELDPNQKKRLVEVEKKVVEEKVTTISQDQEEILDDILEDEFI
jgi:septal ring factor EnvC (AmiA/AmiB activator)